MLKVEKNGKDSAKAIVTLADNTEITFDHTRIFADGFVLEDTSSSSGSFDIGFTSMKTFTLGIMDYDEKYMLNSFENAFVRPYVINDGHAYQRGKYHVHGASRAKGRLNLNCYDDMYNLEKNIDTSVFSIPCTFSEAMNVIAIMCGIALMSNTFTNSNLILNSIDGNITTYRQLAAYIAQCAGSVFRQTDTGLFEFADYKKDVFANADLDGGDLLNYKTGDSADGGTFTYNNGDTHDGGAFGDRENVNYLYELNSCDVDVKDTTITGVSIVIDKEEYQRGTDEYKLTISDNPLITVENVTTILTTLEEKYVGMRFRKLSGKVRSDFRIDAMDPAIITDDKMHSYTCFITNVSYKINEYTTLSCDCKTTDENNASDSSPVTKILAAASSDAERKVKAEAEIRQAALDLISKELSESSGLFETTVEQPDGSNIYYMHDKHTLEESTIVWKLTANAFGISTDGGKTYPYGLDVTGMAILNRIYAVGINCDYLRSGTITGRKINNGNGTFAVDENGNVISNSFKSNNAEITGGTIIINSGSQTNDVIQLNYTDDNGNKYYNKMTTTGARYKIKRIEDAYEWGIEISWAYFYYRSRFTGNPSVVIMDGYVRSDFFSVPDGSSGIYCGGNATFKGNVYNSSGGVVFTSDRNEKHDIVELDEKKITDFIYSLKPVEYKFNKGTSDRKHHGLIAQEVKKSMGNDDWGLYVDKSIKPTTYTDDQGNEMEADVSLGLRYDELIADIIATVQSQNERIKVLEERLRG